MTRRGIALVLGQEAETERKGGKGIVGFGGQGRRGSLVFDFRGGGGVKKPQEGSK